MVWLYFDELAGEKERPVLRNPADIELKLAAAIERELRNFRA